MCAESGPVGTLAEGSVEPIGVNEAKREPEGPIPLHPVMKD